MAQVLIGDKLYVKGKSVDFIGLELDIDEEVRYEDGDEEVLFRFNRIVNLQFEYDGIIWVAEYVKYWERRWGV